MPLVPASMASDIKTQLTLLPFVVAGAELDAFCLAIATGIITNLVANAVVVPTSLVAPPGGGPVTGVGNLT